MWGASQVGLPAVVLLLVLTGSTEGFSTFAGSCKHAGVNHGLDKFEAQRRAGVPLRCVGGVQIAWAELKRHPSVQTAVETGATASLLRRPPRILLRGPLWCASGSGIAEPRLSLYHTNSTMCSRARRK